MLKMPLRNAANTNSDCNVSLDIAGVSSRRGRFGAFPHFAINAQKPVAAGGRAGRCQDTVRSPTCLPAAPTWLGTNFFLASARRLMPEAWRRSIAPGFVQVRTTAGTLPNYPNASFISEVTQLFLALCWVQTSWSIITNPFYGFFGFIPGLSVRRSICFGKNVPEIYTYNYTGNLSDREF